MPFNSIFAWRMKKRIHQIDLFRKYPLDVQNEILNQLLLRASKTEIGQRYGFASIKNYAQYQRQVPLIEYEEFQLYVNRLMKGERHILWPGETKWFAKSSGTTNQRSKFIPVTRESLYDCHFKGGKDLLALYYENFPNRKVYNGKHLVIGGSAQNNQIGIDSYLGDLSAIIVENLPWWAEIRRTPSRETALMPEWEDKLKKIIDETLDEDVHIIVGVPSWTSVLLNKILEHTGKKDIKEVWPNLELFLHGGVSFKPYRDSFDSLINPVGMNYVESYNASEGFFGIQDVANSDELLLMLDYGIFYEFIPMKQFAGTASTGVIALDQVELNENYAIVISTNGGLWRYIIGDTITFTSKSPFRFRVTGRTKSYINIVGEELIVENAEQAMAAVCSKTKARIKDFTAGPIYLEGKQKGRHEWLVEFEQVPENLELFAQLLDEEIRLLNSDYDAKRTQNLVLEPLLLRQLKKGSFEEWLKSKNKLGGQHKVPRLSNDRQLLDELKNREI